MPVVAVTSPEGKTYHVNAPKDATDAQILAYVQRQTAAHAKASTPDTLDQIHGAASAFLNGAVPGAGGVLSGIAGAAMNPSDMGKGFTDARRASDRHEERFKQDHPYLGAAATGLGFVGSMALPVTKVGLAANAARTALGGRMVNAAANGALYGGAGGLLSSHSEGPGSVLRDTARGAVGGAAAGAVLPAVGRIMAPVARPVGAALGRMAAPAVAKAGRMIPGATGRHLQNRAAVLGADRVDVAASRSLGRSLERSEMDPAGLMTELKRRHSMGVPAVPADVSEPLRHSFGTATRRQGPALAAVRRHIDERQRQMSQRVADHVGETLGPVTNVERQADLLNAQARKDAAPLYERSNAQPIPNVQELQELLSRPAGHQALQDATYNLRNQGISPAAEGLIEGADGAYRLGDAPTMQLYDYIKTALDHTVSAGSSPMAAPNVTRDMRGALDIRSSLLDIMDGDGSGPRIPHPDFPNLPSPPPRTGNGSLPPEGLNPYWKPARDRYAGPVQNRKALELGQDMAKAGATDAANRMDGMTTGSQRDFFRLGHRTGLVDDVRSISDLADAAGRLNGSVKTRDAIRTVHGDDASQGLFDRLGAEQDAHRTAVASRGKLKAEEGEAGDTTGSAGRGVIAALTQSPLDAVQHITAAFNGDPALSGATADRVGTVLGSPDPAMVREAMAGVRRAGVADGAAQAHSLSRQQQAAKALGARSGAGMSTPDGEVLIGYGPNGEGGYYPVYGAPGTQLSGDFIPADL